MFNILTDRSRTLEFQRCPRSRFFQYEIGGRGVKPGKLDMNLLVGGCTHQGVQQLLEGKSEDEAVLAAMEGDEANPGYWPKVRNQGLLLAEGEDATYIQKEQGALTEALVLVYSASVLPKLLERFEVLETEQEDVTGLREFYSDGDQYNIDWMSRCDALLLEKDSGDLYAHSLKTAKEWGMRNDNEARHDMQGLSEIWAIDKRMENWRDLMLDDPSAAEQFGGSVPDWFINRQKNGHAPQCFGVKMEYLLKGRREQYPFGSKNYCYASPLIRPWKDSKQDLGAAGWAWKYEFPDPMDESKKHRLNPKQFKKVNIWEIMPIKEWIAILAGHGAAPFHMDALEAQTVLPMEYFRNDDDTKSWQEETGFQESRIAEGAKRANAARSQGDLPAYRRILAEFFPQHRRACDWPYPCSMTEVCFGPEAYLVDPKSSGLYEDRRPHHVPEMEKFAVLDKGQQV